MTPQPMAAREPMALNNFIRETATALIVAEQVYTATVEKPSSAPNRTVCARIPWLYNGAFLTYLAGAPNHRREAQK